MTIEEFFTQFAKTAKVLKWNSKGGPIRASIINEGYACPVNAVAWLLSNKTKLRISSDYRKAGVDIDLKQIVCDDIAAAADNMPVGGEYGKYIKGLRAKLLEIIYNEKKNDQ